MKTFRILEVMDCVYAYDVKAETKSEALQKINENYGGETDDIMCVPEYDILIECPCCEFYVSEENLIEVNPDEHYGFDYVCTECKEYHDEERSQTKSE